MSNLGRMVKVGLAMHRLARFSCRMCGALGITLVLILVDGGGATFSEQTVQAAPLSQVSGLACMLVRHAYRDTGSGFDEVTIRSEGDDDATFDVQVRLRNRSTGVWTSFSDPVEYDAVFCNVNDVTAHGYFKSADPDTFDYAHFRVTMDDHEGKPCSSNAPYTNCRDPFEYFKLMRVARGSTCPSETLHVGGQTISRHPRVTVYYCPN
jgi:hypothetical protein